MRIRKQFKAETSHRLVGSYSKRCQSFHGHSYLFELVLRGHSLNKDEMVIDFGEVKDDVIDFFDAFDHSMVLFDQDPYLDDMVKIMEAGDMRYLVVNYNPTAERMAQHIFKEIKGRGYTVESVRVHETATGWAECDHLYHGDLHFCRIGGDICIK